MEIIEKTESKVEKQTNNNTTSLAPNQKIFNNENNLKENKTDNESESSENSDFDIDYERLTLIQVRAKLEKKRAKKKKNVSFIHKKRANPDNRIEYDVATKKLCNSFCPDYNELNIFLEKCQITEIKPDAGGVQINENEDSKNIFDPLEFMKKNNINKSVLSFEDDLCNNQNYNRGKYSPNNSNYELKEVKPKLFMPRMNADKFILSFQIKDDIVKEKTKEELYQIEKILNSDNLDKYQKNWMSDYIKKINGLSLNDIICKDKKFEIIFDLDLTCIFSFVNSPNRKEALSFKERYPEKNITVLNLELKNSKIYSSIIIRKGVKDFVNYTKDFCNFHVRTNGVFQYAIKIIDFLKKNFGIDFGLIKTRECNNKDSSKYLDDFNDININSNNAIIFDDSTTQWKKEIFNVIQSKKFIDKECGVYWQKDKDISSYFDNDKIQMLNTYSSFYYHKFEKCEHPSWKNQIIYTLPKCPFYQFRDKNAQNYNLVYSGEYLTSPKLQFVYMKNVIKQIYYLVHHNNVPICEAIKLIRLNTLNGKSFYLKYLDEEQKIILSDIIKVCGGEIIYNQDDSIDFMMKTIFLVCSMEYYAHERNSILEELNKNKKFILINEKFILDSYYFMTDMGNRYKDNEYNPEKCFSL